MQAFLGSREFRNSQLLSDEAKDKVRSLTGGKFGENAMKIERAAQDIAIGDLERAENIDYLIGERGIEGEFLPGESQARFTPDGLDLEYEKKRADVNSNKLLQKLEADLGKFSELADQFTLQELEKIDKSRPGLRKLAVRQAESQALERRTRDAGGGATMGGEPTRATAPKWYNKLRGIRRASGLIPNFVIQKEADKFFGKPKLLKPKGRAPSVPFNWAAVRAPAPKPLAPKPKAVVPQAQAADPQGVLPKSSFEQERMLKEWIKTQPRSVRQLDLQEQYKYLEQAIFDGNYSPQGKPPAGYKPTYNKDGSFKEFVPMLGDFPSLETKSKGFIPNLATRIQSHQNMPSIDEAEIPNFYSQEEINKYWTPSFDGDGKIKGGAFKALGTMDFGDGRPKDVVMIPWDSLEDLPRFSELARQSKNFEELSPTGMSKDLDPGMYEMEMEAHDRERLTNEEVWKSKEQRRRKLSERRSIIPTDNIIEGQRFRTNPVLDYKQMERARIVMDDTRFVPTTQGFGDVADTHTLASQNLMETHSTLGDSRHLPGHQLYELKEYAKANPDAEWDSSTFAKVASDDTLSEFQKRLSSRFDKAEGEGLINRGKLGQATDWDLHSKNIMMNKESMAQVEKAFSDFYSKNNGKVNDFDRSAYIDDMVNWMLDKKNAAYEIIDFEADVNMDKITDPNKVNQLNQLQAEIDEVEKDPARMKKIFQEGKMYKELKFGESFMPKESELSTRFTDKMLRDPENPNRLKIITDPETGQKYTLSYSEKLGERKTPAGVLDQLTDQEYNRILDLEPRQRVAEAEKIVAENQRLQTEQRLGELRGIGEAIENNNIDPERKAILNQFPELKQEMLTDELVEKLKKANPALKPLLVRQALSGGMRPGPGFAPNAPSRAIRPSALSRLKFRSGGFIPNFAQGLDSYQKIPNFADPIRFNEDKYNELIKNYGYDLTDPKDVEKLFVDKKSPEYQETLAEVLKSKGWNGEAASMIDDSEEGEKFRTLAKEGMTYMAMPQEDLMFDPQGTGGMGSPAQAIIKYNENEATKKGEKLPKDYDDFLEKEKLTYWTVNTEHGVPKGEGVGMSEVIENVPITTFNNMADSPEYIATPKTDEPKLFEVAKKWLSERMAKIFATKVSTEASTENTGNTGVSNAMLGTIITSTALAALYGPKIAMSVANYKKRAVAKTLLREDGQLTDKGKRNAEFLRTPQGKEFIKNLPQSDARQLYKQNFEEGEKPKLDFESHEDFLKNLKGDDLRYVADNANVSYDSNDADKKVRDNINKKLEAERLSTSTPVVSPDALMMAPEGAGTYSKVSDARRKIELTQGLSGEGAEALSKKMVTAIATPTRITGGSSAGKLDFFNPLPRTHPADPSKMAAGADELAKQKNVILEEFEATVTPTREDIDKRFAEAVDKAEGPGVKAADMVSEIPSFAEVEAVSGVEIDDKSRDFLSAVWKETAGRVVDADPLDAKAFVEKRKDFISTLENQKNINFETDENLLRKMAAELNPERFERFDGSDPVKKGLTTKALNRAKGVSFEDANSQQVKKSLDLYDQMKKLGFTDDELKQARDWAKKRIKIKFRKSQGFIPNFAEKDLQTKLFEYIGKWEDPKLYKDYVASKSDPKALKKTLKSYYPTPNDVPTIGFGRTVGVDKNTTSTLGAEISSFQSDLKSREEKVKKLVGAATYDKLNINEKTAINSLAYNIGLGALGKSNALKKLKAGDKKGYLKEASEFRKQGGKILKGLETRRADEKALFLTSTKVDKKALGFVPNFVSLPNVKMDSSARKILGDNPEFIPATKEGIAAEASWGVEPMVVAAPEMARAGKNPGLAVINNLEGTLSGARKAHNGRLDPERRVSADSIVAKGMIPNFSAVPPAPDDFDSGSLYDYYNGKFTQISNEKEAKGQLIKGSGRGGASYDYYLKHGFYPYEWSPSVDTSEDHMMKTPERSSIVQERIDKAAAAAQKEQERLNELHEGKKALLSHFGVFDSRLADIYMEKQRAEGGSYNPQANPAKMEELKKEFDEKSGVNLTRGGYSKTGFMESLSDKNILDPAGVGHSIRRAVHGAYEGSYSMDTGVVSEEVRQMVAPEEPWVERPYIYAGKHYNALTKGDLTPGETTKLLRETTPTFVRDSQYGMENPVYNTSMAKERRAELRALRQEKMNSDEWKKTVGQKGWGNDKEASDRRMRSTRTFAGPFDWVLGLGAGKGATTALKQGAARTTVREGTEAAIKTTAGKLASGVSGETLKKAPGMALKLGKGYYKDMFPDMVTYGMYSAAIKPTVKTVVGAARNKGFGRSAKQAFNEVSWKSAAIGGAIDVGSLGLQVHMMLQDKGVNYSKAEIAKIMGNNWMETIEFLANEAKMDAIDWSNPYQFAQDMMTLAGSLKPAADMLLSDTKPSDAYLDEILKIKKNKENEQQVETKFRLSDLLATPEQLKQAKDRGLNYRDLLARDVDLLANRPDVLGAIEKSAEDSMAILGKGGDEAKLQDLEENVINFNAFEGRFRRKLSAKVGAERQETTASDYMFDDSGFYFMQKGKRRNFTEEEAAMWSNAALKDMAERQAQNPVETSFINQGPRYATPGRTKERVHRQSPATQTMLQFISNAHQAAIEALQGSDLDIGSLSGDSIVRTAAQAKLMAASLRELEHPVRAGMLDLGDYLGDEGPRIVSQSDFLEALMEAASEMPDEEQIKKRKELMKAARATLAKPDQESVTTASKAKGLIPNFIRTGIGKVGNWLSGASVSTMDKIAEVVESQKAGYTQPVKESDVRGFRQPNGEVYTINNQEKTYPVVNNNTGEVSSMMAIEPGQGPANVAFHSELKKRNLSPAAAEGVIPTPQNIAGQSQVNQAGVAAIDYEALSALNGVADKLAEASQELAKGAEYFTTSEMKTLNEIKVDVGGIDIGQITDQLKSSIAENIKAAVLQIIDEKLSGFNPLNQQPPGSTI